MCEGCKGDRKALAGHPAEYGKDGNRSRAVVPAELQIGKHGRNNKKTQALTAEREQSIIKAEKRKNPSAEEKRYENNRTDQRRGHHSE